MYQPIKKAETIAETPALAVNLANTDSRIENDIVILRSYSAALKDMSDEMFLLREKSQVYTTDYFEPREHDQIENLLFRYLICRNSLWELVHFYMNYRDHFSDPVLQTKGFLVGFWAGLHIISYSSLVVSTFLNEPAGIAKINEAYPTSDIPRGTYDTLFSQVTAAENLKAIKIAWELFQNEIADTSSLASQLSKNDSLFKYMVEDIGRLHKESEERVQNILEKKALLLPDLTNQLRHSLILKLAAATGESVGDNLYAMRGLLFTVVGDLKAPVVAPLQFSPDQKKLIKSLVQPGDIILTFSAGYLSNIFLPGKFKHGIAYVGTLEERRRAGFVESRLSGMPKPELEKIARTMETRRLGSGYDADVIEAVSEGVIFNSLEYLMNAHFNRLVVLRPHLSPQERIEALAKAFMLIDSKYDFKFDFNDGSSQCCTELLYRMLNLRGPYSFSLKKRAGTFTLSADDIAEYYRDTTPCPFDFVLYAEEGPAAKESRALIHTAKTNGEQLFRDFISKK